MRGGKTIPDVRRLMRFVTLLSTVDGIDPHALPEARDVLVSLLQKAKRELLQTDRSFQDNLADVATIKVKALSVNQVDYRISEQDEQSVTVSEANGDDLYRQAKNRLGDDIVVEFMRRELEVDDPIRTKLEIFLLAQRSDVLHKLESLAKRRVTALRQRFQPALDSLPSSKQMRYQELWALSRQPEPVTLYLSPDLSWPKEDDAREWPRHLYQQPCWLRNLPRQSWSLAYWYEASDGRYAPGYPDLVVIRKTPYGRIVDMYEPHGAHLSDGWHKAKGMARFADNHAGSYGHIAMARVRNNQVTILDFSRDEVRTVGLRLNNDRELDNLFYSQGIPIRQP